jgi:hypothetical protein
MAETADATTLIRKTVVEVMIVEVAVPLLAATAPSRVDADVDSCFHIDFKCWISIEKLFFSVFSIRNHTCMAYTLEQRREFLANSATVAMACNIHHDTCLILQETGQLRFMQSYLKRYFT